MDQRGCQTGSPARSRRGARAAASPPTELGRAVSRAEHVVDCAAAGGAVEASSPPVHRAGLCVQGTHSRPQSPASASAPCAASCRRASSSAGRPVALFGRTHAVACASRLRVLYSRCSRFPSQATTCGAAHGAHVTRAVRRRTSRRHTSCSGSPLDE